MEIAWLQTLYSCTLSLQCESLIMNADVECESVGNSNTFEAKCEQVS